MCQGAHRNDVDTCLGVVADRFESDAAGGFQRNTSSATAHGITRLFQGEIVQKDGIRSRLDRLVHAFGPGHFDFDPEIATDVVSDRMDC